MLLIAQTAGGQVRRPNKQVVKPTPKPTPKPKPKQNTATRQTPNRERVLQDLINNMVYVEGGTFMMGAT